MDVVVGTWFHDFGSLFSLPLFIHRHFQRLHDVPLLVARDSQACVGLGLLRVIKLVGRICGFWNLIR